MVSSSLAETAQLARAKWLPVMRGALFTGGAQGAIQLLTFLNGIAAIRLLPLREYAYYTIINAVLGTMTVLTDGGVSQSVMAQGGKVWNDRAALGAVVAGGQKLRRRFALFAGLIAMPMAFVLLQKQGASAGLAVLLILSTVPLFLSAFAGQLFEVMPRLHQSLWPLQRIQLATSGVRLVAVVSALLLFPAAWITSLASGVAQLWSTFRIRTLAQTFADWRQPPDPVAWKRMNAQVRRALPGAIYFAFSGQITIWLISIFGTSEAVAQVGALGRLAMAFNLFSSVFALMLIPRFARMPERGGAGVLTRYWEVQGVLLLTMSLVVLAVAAFPEPALFVLGSAYSATASQVTLMAAGGALNVLSGSAYAMAAARGVVVSPVLAISYSLIVQAALIASLPLGAVGGVLWLGALGSALLWLLHAGNFTFTRVRAR